MNSFRNFFIFFIFNFTLINFNTVHSNDKISYIDLDYLIDNTNFGLNILKEINILNENNLNLLREKEKEIKEFEEEIINKKNIISEDELKKKYSVLRTTVKKFNSDKDIMVDEMIKLKENKLNEFFKKINPIIQEYMKENSIDILFERKNIFIGQKNSDITNDIIEIINTRLK